MLTEAINRIMKSADPNAEVLNKKMHGLIILQFPEDHVETTEVYGTFLGKICPSHAIEYIQHMSAEHELEANPLAS